MTWTKKKKPSLVRNIVLSGDSFVYITKHRRNNHEPLYKILDRILEEHERLTKEETEEEDEELTTS